MRPWIVFTLLGVFLLIYSALVLLGVLEKVKDLSILRRSALAVIYGAGAVINFYGAYLLKRSK